MVKTRGTKEWSDSNENIQFGCRNGCRYCYAQKMSKRRVGQWSHRATEDDWINHCSIRWDKLTKNIGKRKGRIMFPTTHDIYEENYLFCAFQLKKILRAGNDVLITTKPRLKIISLLCDELYDWKSQVQFRFTIGSTDDAILKYFEPNAPTYFERASCVKHAYIKGYKTSLSIEPFLDDQPYVIIHDLESYITESMWLGVLNDRWLSKKQKQDILNHSEYKINQIFTYAEPENLNGIVKKCQLFGNNKLRLKDSIQHILGCEQL